MTREAVSPTMPVRVTAEHEVVEACPGTVVPCSVRVYNVADEPLTFTVRVVGIGLDSPSRPVPWEPLEPGGVLDLEVPVTVPETMAPGDHAVAVEITVVSSPAGADGVPRSRPGRARRPLVAIAPLTIKVGSLDQVVVSAHPTVVRGRFGGRFQVEVVNRRHEEVSIGLRADAPEVRVEFEQAQVVVPPGATLQIPARVRGGRHWWGEERRHVLNVEARSAASPSYSRVVYTARPVLARTLRGGIAALVLLSLWAGMLGSAAFWFSRQNDAPAAGTASDTEPGAGQPGTGADGTGSGTDGDGGGGGGGDGGSEGGGTAPGTDPDALTAPTSTVVRGVVKAGETGDDSGVVVTLTPLLPESDVAAGPDSSANPDESSDVAAVMGLLADAVRPLAGAVEERGSGDGKFWSARYGTYEGAGLGATRATFSVTAGSDADGVWTIDDVPLRRSYELSFAKPGFDRQSFVVTPTDDGKPVEIDLVLQPASGALGGRINGPAGGLGGVAVTITDGVLSYSTTTSTATGDRGAWSVEGLSTPATYTITAVLDGYGTLVAQQTLEVGERETGLSFTMRAGVGSIGGRVTGDGGPLGGVTLSATGGGQTRTTSTLTAGATGTYLFPELSIPGVYTLTVSAPGFTTQTRQVSVAGNVTGIDVDLVRSTARVIGVVTSDDPDSALPPVPVAGVGVEVSLDSITARTTTAVAPDLGSFEVADLPPGTYTISFARYDHVPQSRLITVVAGQLLDLGEIPLVYDPIEEFVNDADASFFFFDSKGDTLDNATISLTDIAGRLTPLQVPGVVGVTSATIPDVPIGTYRVLAQRPGYRPFELSKFTVGTQSTSLNVPMLQYGQAFGQLIDGLAPFTQVGDALQSTRPLSLYRLLVYEVVQGGAYVCRGLVPKPFEAPVGGRITWQIEPSLGLLAGDYRLRVTPHPADPGSQCSQQGGQNPPGYAARPDATGDVASFTIPADSDEPVDVGDIRMFPYPVVRGVVMVPSWNPNTESVDLAPAAALATELAGVSVTLQCGAESKVAPLEFGVADDRVTFQFTRAVVASLFNSPFVPADGLLGICSLKMNPSGYSQIDRVLPTALTIPTAFTEASSTSPGGGPYDDRAVAVVLTDDPDDLAGVAAWWDDGKDVLRFVDGATVEATAVTGFDVGQGVDTDGPGPTAPVADDPQPDPTTISSTTDSSGVWGFLHPEPRQVADQATYSVTATNFQPASFTLLVDEGIRELTDPQGFTAAPVDGGSIELRLTPLPGSISGEVTIVSGAASPVVDAVVLATRPDGSIADIEVSADGSFVVDPAEAGTWFLSYSQSADSNLMIRSGGDIDEAFVDAGTPAPAVEGPEYWDLAQVEVEFNDLDGIALSGNDYSLNVTADLVTPVTTFPAALPDTESAGSTGVAVVRRLPVDATVHTADVAYRLTIGADGFDLPTAEWTLYDDVTGDQLDAGVDARTINVTVRSGTRLRVELFLPAYGAITGTVWGMLSPPSTDPGDLEVLDLLDGLTVSAQRVQADGSSLPDPPDSVTATRVPLTGDVDEPGFRLDVPAGFYIVTASHPDFVTGVSAPLQVTIGGTTEYDEFLAIELASLELIVLTDTASGTRVVGADVGLWPEGTTALETLDTDPLYAGLTVAAADPLPSIDFDPSSGTGIIPGDYLLVIRKSDADDPDRDDHFPVVAHITVPRGPTPEARTIRRTAVMPRTDGAISGAVTARNLDGSPLPVPTGLTVDRTYDIPQAGGTDGIENEATENDQRPSPSPSESIDITPDTDGLDAGFLFGDLAAGMHELQFGNADGFSTPEALDVLVDGVGTTTVDVEYVADDVTWQVVITSHGEPVSGLTLTYTGPFGATDTATELTGDDVGTYQFIGVAPEVDPYRLALNSDYYRPADIDDLEVQVAPQSATKVSSLEVVELAIITGTARKLTGATTSTVFGTTDSVSLLDSSGLVVSSVNTDAAGGYRFVVDAGTDAVAVGAAPVGYKPATVDIEVLPGDTSIAPDLEVKAYARATFTVTNVAEGDTPSLTVSPSTGVTVGTQDGALVATGLDPDVEYVFTVSAPNRMPRTVPASGAHDPAIGGNFEQSVALEGYLTVSGIVDNGATEVAGALVALITGSTVSDTATSAADGTFDLTIRAYGTYVVEAQKKGVGAASSTAFTVAVGTSSVADVELSLDPRSLTVTFTQGTGQPVVTITLGGTPGTAGQLVFITTEASSLAWTATASGHLQLGGTIPLTENGTFPLSAMAPLTATAPIAMVDTVISGSVVSITGNATARLCPTSVAPASCDNATDYGSSVSLTSTSRTFSWSEMPPNDYYVLVRQGKDSSQSATISISLTMTANPAAVSVPTPS